MLVRGSLAVVRRDSAVIKGADRQARRIRRERLAKHPLNLLGREALRDSRSAQKRRRPISRVVRTVSSPEQFADSILPIGIGNLRILEELARLGELAVGVAKRQRVGLRGLINSPEVREDVSKQDAKHGTRPRVVGQLEF